MQCKACGADIVPESVYCGKCGARLDEQREIDPSSPTASEVLAGGSEPTKGSTASPAERFKSRVQVAQNDDDEEEKQLWEGSYSPKAMVATWLGGVAASVLVGIGCILWVKPLISALLVLLIGLVLLWGALGLLYAYRRLRVHYELTNQRFIHKSGIFKRVTDRIEVIDMDDVTYEQGLVERMLGVGCIKIVSSDRSHPELLLRGIDEVQRIATLIDDVRRAERRRRGLHIESI